MATRTRHFTDQLSPFSQPTGREHFPRFYGSKVVKPNGTWARSVIPLYRCRHLSTGDSKSSFRKMMQPPYANETKTDRRGLLQFG